MRKSLVIVAVAGAFCFPALSIAADAAPASPHTFTGNIGLVSNYVFRGLTQTNDKPAIQGGFDYSHASGFYAGTSLSNISWYTDQNSGVKSAPQALSAPTAVQNTPPFQTGYVTGKSNQASLEWDFYGGYKNSFAGGDWNYDVGVLRYQYPGTYENIGAYRNPSTTEIYGALGYKWVTLKYSKAISPYTFGVNESKGASYIDLSATVPLSEGLNLLAHVGHQRYPGNANLGYFTTAGALGANNSLFSYTDYRLGVTKDYAGFTFGLAYTYANTKHTAQDNDTTVYMNAFGKNIGRSQAVLSVTKTF